MIYANNAGTSWPKPPGMSEAVVASLAADPVEAAKAFEPARDAVCRLLGIADRERLLFTSGCTQALAVGIEDLPWREGDVIVTSSLEHHAVVRPARKLERERGVSHVAAPYRDGEPVDLDFVRDVLGRGRVRLLAVSAASNVTGELLPIDELAALAHEHDALCLVDAAQAVGIVPVDVEASGADMIAFAGHKGPLGPQGIGALWARPGVEFESPAASCNIGERSAARQPCSPFPGYCDVGGLNLAGAAALAASVEWVLVRGVDEVGGHGRALASRLRAGLRERKGCTVYGVDDDARRTAAVSIELDGLPVARAESFFLERGIIVRAGEHCAPTALESIGAPGGTIRISFGSFNTADDVDAVLASIDEARADCGS